MISQAQLEVTPSGTSLTRQLTLPVTPVPGESLIGLLARAARLNVLGATTIILEDVGLNLLHPGTIGQDIADKAPALAAHLGCKLSDVSSRCHPYLSDEHGPQDVLWGNGALLRTDLLVEDRRVSPASLRIANFHRAAWMNKLLPYCPESLELLTASCRACGRKLGWRRAWGIDRCDHIACRKELVRTTSEVLRADLVAGYRRFAALVSADPAIRDAARADLHVDVQRLPPSVLLNLTLQLGAAVRSEPVRLHRNTIHLLPAEMLASIAALGARLLDRWPQALRIEITSVLEGLDEHDGRSRRRFIGQVRKLADRKNRAEQIHLVRQAIPEAFEHLGVALASLSRPVVNGSEVCRAVGIDPAELRSLREAGLISHRKVGAGRRVLARYDQAEVNKLAEAWRGSVPASRLEQRLGIPRYAIEQLVCLGEIASETHPSVVHLGSGLRLPTAEVERFTKALMLAAQPSPPPEDAITLRKAIRRFGGRLKPWGHLLAEFRAGRMRFWLRGSGAFTRSAMISAADRWKMDCLAFDEGSWPDFHFSDEITQIDASDVLNLDSLQIRPVVASGELVFKASGVALLTSRQAVLDLARRYVAVAEIAARLHLDSRRVPAFMADNLPSMIKGPAGWDRAQFASAFPDLR